MKLTKTIKNLILILAIVIVFVVIDQVTKHLVALNIKTTPIKVIPNFFYLEYAENTGAAWGMFAGNNFVILGMPFIALIIFGFLISRSTIFDKKFYTIGLALMIAGTIGNYIDRIFLKYVIDFLSFRFGSYHYPNFNIADSCLVIGVIMFSIDILFLEDIRNKESNNNEKINN